MTNLPSSSSQVIFACDISAIQANQRQEHLENLEKLFGQVQAVEERSDGYALQLPCEAATLLQTAQFVALERLCCPFFGFNLGLSPAAQSFWLYLTGPQGVKPFIVAELGGYVRISFG